MQMMNFPYLRRMRLEFFIARKVAGSQQKSFSRLIIRIAMAAIAICMAVMIISTALIRGFKHQISEKIFGFWGHIHITDATITRSLEQVPVSTEQDFYPWLDTVRQVSFTAPGNAYTGFNPRKVTTRSGIRHIQVYANKPGIIKTKTDLEGIILKGIGPDFEWSFLQSYLEGPGLIAFPDTAPSRDIIISRQTADRMQLGIGDQFVIHFIKNNDQLRRLFTVKNIYKTGLEEYDRKFALVDIRNVQSLLGWSPDQVGGFEVFIEDIRDLDDLAEYVYYEKIPNPLYVETIRQKFPSIFEWLSLQDTNEKVILLLMAVVAIINMTTTLIILILDRTNMIGVLKALGARNSSVQLIFLYHAAIIILTGLFWGNVAGIGLSLLQQHYPFIHLPEADYYLKTAPIELDPMTIIALNIATLVLTICMLILPSFLIARISPVKTIQFR